MGLSNSMGGGLQGTLVGMIYVCMYFNITCKKKQILL